MAECAAKLVGCYRKGDAADPETYMTGVMAVLSEYPADIVRHVTDPRTGLPGRLKWLPTIAEVREACEAIEAPRRRDRERERMLAEQMRYRGLPAPSDDEARERAIANVKGRFGDRWGIEREHAIAACHESAEEACMRVLGISAEEFAKIPDRNGRISGVQLGDEALARAKGEAA